MRIGVHGAGHMSQMHAAIYAKIPEVEVAAVVGRDEEKVKSVAAQLGVPRRSYHRTLAPRLPVKQFRGVARGQRFAKTRTAGQAIATNRKRVWKHECGFAAYLLPARGQGETTSANTFSIGISEDMCAAWSLQSTSNAVVSPAFTLSSS